jgi:hypothetical protein
MPFATILTRASDLNGIISSARGTECAIPDDHRYSMSWSAIGPGFLKHN